MPPSVSFWPSVATISLRLRAGTAIEQVPVGGGKDDPQRDAAIQDRFGPQVAELVRRDRQQNVRRAFRSFPLHELPLAQRTINPYTFYETYLSRGRIVFLPVLMIGAAAGVAGMAIRTVYRVVREILHPRVDQDEDVPSDTYWAALRKIHRMRKPVFMGSLWLRARFDAEYLGLPLPSAPPVGAAGFEPATWSTQNSRATRLRYAP